MNAICWIVADLLLGQYPWHVALYHSQGIQLTYICGGSLISEDYVVTAAHCVTNPSTGKANSPQNFLLYLGVHYEM